MSNIVPLHKCTVCGEMGRLRTITWKDETITSLCCDKCAQTSEDFLARMRPIFESMRACGVPGEIANDTMTYLLDQLPDTDMLEPADKAG